MIVRVSTVEEVQAAVRAHARLRPVAGGTKPALSAAPPDAVPLDVSALTGILDFSPAECTFTARPGTPIAEIERLLAAHGLYLPFEPPLAARGATLGGTLAAGVSGPGRFRYGGVRDFLLGVHLIDGTGRRVAGGGRVVKNAAGFSLHHLMLGSLGRLGVLVEVTCKVFPRPPAQVTLLADAGTLAQALDLLARLRRSPFELDAADLLPPSLLVLRIAGLYSSLAARVESLARFLAPASVQQLSADDADAAWLAARELIGLLPEETARTAGTTTTARATGTAKTADTANTADAADAANEADTADIADTAPTGSDGSAFAADGDGAQALVRVAITPSRIAPLEERLSREAAASGIELPPRRYSAGGDLAWIGWRGSLPALDRLLLDVGLSGLVLASTPASASSASPASSNSSTSSTSSATTIASAASTASTASTAIIAPAAPAASAAFAGPARSAEQIASAGAADPASRAAGRADVAIADPFVGPRPDDLLLRRIRQVLDPRGVFA